MPPEYTKILEPCVPSPQHAGLSFSRDEFEQEASPTKGKLENWRRIQVRSVEHLTFVAKDLRVLGYWIESCTRLNRSRGLAESLCTASALIEKSWDSLVPDSLNQREATLLWGADVGRWLLQAPLTDASDGKNYSFVDFQEAQFTSKKVDGADPATQKLAIQARVDQGFPRLEDWDAAVAKTPSAFYSETLKSLGELNKSWGQFADVLKKRLPDLDLVSAQYVVAESGIRQLVEAILETRGKLETAQPAAEAKPETDNSAQAQTTERTPESFAVRKAHSPSDADDEWQIAMRIARADIEKGMPLLAGLADGNANGRTQFFRKLDAAELFLEQGLLQPATAVLEDLESKIKTPDLAAWEGEQVVARVWSALYACRMRTNAKEKANELLIALCKLAPWHAQAAIKAYGK